MDEPARCVMCDQLILPREKVRLVGDFTDKEVIVRAEDIIWCHDVCPSSDG